MLCCAVLCVSCRSERCEGFSGADVAALVKEAAVLALKESMAALMSAAAAAGSAQQQPQQQRPGAPAVSAGFAQSAADVAAGGARPLVYLRHFEAALSSVTPSVSRKDRRAYEAMRVRLRGARAHISANPAAAAGSEGTGGGGAAAGAGAGAGGEGSGMDAEDGAAAPAAAGVGDDMEGVDDAPEPADPMKDD